MRTREGFHNTKTWYSTVDWVRANSTHMKEEKLFRRKCKWGKRREKLKTRFSFSYTKLDDFLISSSSEELRDQIRDCTHVLDVVRRQLRRIENYVCDECAWDEPQHSEETTHLEIWWKLCNSFVFVYLRNESETFLKSTTFPTFVPLKTRGVGRFPFSTSAHRAELINVITSNLMNHSDDELREIQSDFFSISRKSPVESVKLGELTIFTELVIRPIS